MLFSIQRKPTDPKHEKIFNFSGGCKLDDRTLRTLAEEIGVAAEVLPFWDLDSRSFVVGIQQFIFNALLYIGSFPEEYEPEKVLRSFLEKKGRWKSAIKAARFLGQEAYRPAHPPSAKEQEPMVRPLALRPLGTTTVRPKVVATKTDLGPTLQDAGSGGNRSSSRRLTPLARRWQK